MVAYCLLGRHEADFSSNPTIFIFLPRQSKHWWVTPVGEIQRWYT